MGTQKSQQRTYEQSDTVKKFFSTVHDMWPFWAFLFAGVAFFVGIQLPFPLEVALYLGLLGVLIEMRRRNPPSGYISHNHIEQTNYVWPTALVLLIMFMLSCTANTLSDIKHNEARNVGTAVRSAENAWYILTTPPDVRRQDREEQEKYLGDTQAPIR